MMHFVTHVNPLSTRSRKLPNSILGLHYRSFWAFWRRRRRLLSRLLSLLMGWQFPFRTKTKAVRYC
jgi:hypothetical protein